jgi:hypothetical protein
VLLLLQMGLKQKNPPSPGACQVIGYACQPPLDGVEMYPEQRQSPVSKTGQVLGHARKAWPAHRKVRESAGRHLVHTEEVAR